MVKAILNCTNLSVEYKNGVNAVRGVSFNIDPSECLALVGESGCGKTSIAHAALGLLPSTASIGGSIRINGNEVIGASTAVLQQLRGRTIGFVSQDPFESCNPLDKVKLHISEAWHAHRLKIPNNKIPDLLSELGIKNSNIKMKQFPHQWSGGMLQRATIAAAIAHKPSLVIADEPTSALDADISDTTLTLLKQAGTAILLISHDIDVVKRHADRIAVIYAGKIVEINDVKKVLSTPKHPYTIALLRAIPQSGRGLPHPLPGTPPDLSARNKGCSFAPRCPYVKSSCFRFTPVLRHGVACLVMGKHGFKRDHNSIIGLHKHILYESGGSPSEPESKKRQIPSIYKEKPVAEVHHITKIYGKGTRTVNAVVDASLRIYKGEIVGICGSSGCGKSTFLRILSTIEVPDDGTVHMDSQYINNDRRGGSAHKLLRRGYVMPIFQDPVRSLDQQWPIWRTITEPLMARQFLSKKVRRKVASKELGNIGLGHIDINARPYELSLGQCQRISIIRALISNPALITADEPTSALDASVSATILHLLADAAAKGTAIVIVSHDIAVLNALCHRVLTMRDGVL